MGCEEIEVLRWKMDWILTLRSLRYVTCFLEAFLLGVDLIGRDCAGASGTV